jgi:kynureninase
MIFENSLTFAQRMDAQDSLRAFRDEFHFPVHGDGPVIYYPREHMRR